MPQTAIFYYIILISVISIFVCIYDKSAARKGKRRISEKTLFALCFLGGSLSMFITMRFIRHKTLHKRFMIGIPLIIVLQTGLVLFIFSKLY